MLDIEIMIMDMKRIVAVAMVMLGLALGAQAQEGVVYRDAAEFPVYGKAYEEGPPGLAALEKFVYYPSNKLAEWLKSKTWQPIGKTPEQAEAMDRYARYEALPLPLI